MKNFEVERVSERDQQGRLVRTGCYWREQEMGSMTNGALAFGLVALCLVVAVMLFASGQPVAGFVAIIVGPAALGVFLTVSVPGQKCGVVFLRDGTISTPFGFPGWRANKIMTGHHRQILSIEATPARGVGDRRLYQVRVLFDSGDIALASEHLRELGAIKVAAQLNIALEEMRKALASGQHPDDPVAAQPTGRIIIN